MTKKIKISLLILVWGIVAIQLYVNEWEQNKRKATTTTAFSVIDRENPKATIKGCGFFGNLDVEEKTKERMVKNLASKLGITGDFELEQKILQDKEICELKKLGQCATTTVRIIEQGQEKLVPEQYVVIEIETKENPEKVMNLYEKVQRIYEEIGMWAEVNLEFELEMPGNGITRDGYPGMENLLERMDAKQVDCIWENNLHTVYAYSRNIPAQIKLKDKKVNLQYVLWYDEEEDKTHVKIGIPIVNSSY